MPDPQDDPAHAPVFPGGGLTGEVMRGTDWSKSSLGPAESWPSALKAMVRAMLCSRQPMMIFWGPDLINFYNDASLPFLGEKHPSAIGQRAEDCWSDAWPVVGLQLRDVVEKGAAILHESLLVPVRRKGRLDDAWWNYSYSPLFDDACTIAGVLVVVTETTVEVASRKQLEAAKKDAEVARLELQNVIMQAPLPMAILKGPDHRYELANPSYVALVQREVVGKTVREAFTLEEVGYYLPIVDHVYQTGELILTREAPLRLPDRNGVVEDRFLDIGWYPYRQIDGAIAGVLAILHDVSDQVKARMQVERTLVEREKLLDLIQQSERARVALHARERDLRLDAEAANRAKDEFLATVSHELRTPLTAILGWAHMLKEGRDPTRLEKGLTIIERNARSQAKLIEDILDVSRIISGKLLLNMGRVELATVIQNAIESIKPAATAKHLQLDVEVEGGQTGFVADEDRVQQVIWNLLSNAVKFTPKGGMVSVSASQNDDTVVIRIRDTGRGIPAEFLPYVFDRFRQEEASTTKQQAGLGLGLSIVRHLVEAHGGTIHVISDGPGRGATFEVVLPIREVERPDVLVTRARNGRGVAESNDASFNRLTGVHVLVVDDEEDSRDLVAMVLEDSGARVTQASSVRAAMKVVTSGDITAIVSDIGMPEEDGYSFITRVRSGAESLRMRDLPALALTAYARPEDRDRAMQAGFQEHLVKPIDPVQLVEAVATLLRR